MGGWYDSELTELGLVQAGAIAQRLGDLIPAFVPTEIHSSDLLRTLQTAEVIARQFDLPVQTTPDLREKSYGEAEGQPQAWLEARFVYPPRSGNRLDHDEGLAGAESRREFASRIYRAMDRIMAGSCPCQIVVTHGGALTFVVAAWIGMPLEATSYFAVKSTSGGITHLTEDNAFHNRIIACLNDTSHLNTHEAT